MRKTGPVRVQSLSVIFRFAHKKRNKYRHTFASHVCTGQDRKKRFHQNIGTLHPHISHHSEIEIFFVRARIIRETEKRVPSGPDLSYGCRSSLLFIFAHKMNRRENQPRALKCSISFCTQDTEKTKHTLALRSDNLSS